MSFKGTNILQAIREEINRFENVHPRIYAVYDILDALPPEMGPYVDQMRQHVAAIEDSFVNSQEWTLSRGVKELRLGIVGAIGSGKSSLVHRYLTGTYSQDDSPEGGRFKKEVTVDGHCYLLLIRDEGSLPDAQFTHWADAVIFVFAVDNEATFDFVWTAYSRMSHFRNISGLPIVLVGTQDGISESSPRVIDEKRARRLAADIHTGVFLETCALYGLNVDRVFLETCQRIIQFLAQHGLLHNANSQQQVSAALAQQLAQQNTIPPMVAAKPMPAPRVAAKSPEQMQLPPQPVQPPYKSNDGSTAVAYVQQRYNQVVDGMPRNAPSANNSTASLAAALPPNSAYHPSRPPAPPPVSAAPSSAVGQKPLPPGAVPTIISRHTQQLSSSELHYDVNRQASASALHGNSGYADNSSFSTNGRQMPPQQTPVGSGGRKSLGSMRPSGNDSGSQGSSNAPGMVSLMHQLVSHLHKSNSFTENDGSQMGDRSELTVSVSTAKDSGDGSGSPPDKSKSAEPPGDTPNQQRKTKRRSNIFSRSNKDDKDPQSGDVSVTGSAGGAGAAKGGGRVVPVKEGILHKRCGKSGSALSRETWKKKYVVLLPDGRIIYHPNMHDYLDGEHGKVITLRHSTVKVPGGLPAGSSTGDDTSNQLSTSSASQQTHSSLTSTNSYQQQPPQQLGSTNPSQQSQNQSQQQNKQQDQKGDAPKPVKRGGRRSRAKTDSDSDANANIQTTEFSLVSLDGKQWVFDCTTTEERDEWVTAIQRQIVSCLQANDSGRPGGQPAHANAAAARSIRAVPGNNICADCSAPDPAWAVYNAGVVVCIDCSGVHRQLGVHVSRVKSLDLDDWPPELVAVMCAIGNQMANSVLEAVLKPGVKPNRHSTRDEREWFVRAKYEHRHFATNLALSSHGENVAAVHQQLVDAVAAENIWRLLASIYSLTSSDSSATSEISRPYSVADRRTALHVAVQLDSLAFVQLLLLHQADTTVRDQDGRTPTDYARSPAVSALLQQASSSR